jgi:hypothetical protein
LVAAQDQDERRLKPDFLRLCGSGHIEVRADRNLSSVRAISDLINRNRLSELRIVPAISLLIADQSTQTKK